MLDTIFFFNFDYNMRLAEQNLSSNRRRLQVPTGHNSNKSILLLTREKNTRSAVSFASTPSSLPQVDFVLCVCAYLPWKPILAQFWGHGIGLTPQYVHCIG